MQDFAPATSVSDWNPDAIVLFCCATDPDKYLPQTKRLEPEHFADVDLGAAFADLRSMYERGMDMSRPDVAETLEGFRLATKTNIREALDRFRIGDVAPRFVDAVQAVFDRGWRTQGVNAMRVAAREFEDLDKSHREIGDKVQSLVAKFAANTGQDRGDLNERSLSHEAMRRWSEEPDQLLEFGMPALDAITFGMVEDDVIVIGGRTGYGKTILACEIALNFMLAGRGVIYFSGETSNLEITNRHIASLMARNNLATGHGYVPAYRDLMRHNPLRPLIDQQRVEEVVRAVMGYGEILQRARVVPPGNLSVESITADCYAMRDELAEAGYPLALVVVDHLKLVRGRGKSTYEEVSHVSTTLANLARQLRVPMLQLSQLNRGTSERPVIRDLKDSGDIENNASVVALIHRPDVHARQQMMALDPSADDEKIYFLEHQAQINANKLEVHIVKARSGEHGMAEMRINPAASFIYPKPGAATGVNLDDF